MDAEVARPSARVNNHTSTGLPLLRFGHSVGLCCRSTQLPMRLAKAGCALQAIRDPSRAWPDIAKHH
eukprot:scaffold2773_cov410-Prasinococcus_capsulatus_cf.AAC.22